MGSVKDLEIVKKPSKNELGLGYFLFSDRYSIFDWGKMPDLIPGKGKALAVVGAFIFEVLERKGIKTHYEGIIENDSKKRIDELERPSNKMSILLARKPKFKVKNGKYVYESLKGKKSYLIPLEVIFRNSIPIGSSIRRRFTPKEINLDLETWPDRPIDLDTPMIDFSTKLERKDRYLDEEEARKLSGLTREEFKKLKELTKIINSVITQESESRGLKHLDGKLEFIYYKGDILLADVAGTFDESRFSFDGVQISKEIVRQWYKKNDYKWYMSVKNAKKRAEKMGKEDWKSLVNKRPKNLDPSILKTVENLYKAGANSLVGRKFFEAPRLKDVVKELKEGKI